MMLSVVVGLLMLMLPIYVLYVLYSYKVANQKYWNEMVDRLRNQ